MLPEDSKRLEKIDALSDLRLDQHVSLPMIVVAGDQSSGKSSLLEAFSGLPLPRDAGLCTRFPVQIAFKRSQTTKVTVSINSIDDSTSKEFGDFESLDGPALIELLHKACETLSLPQPGQEKIPGQKSFSNDVLKIELCGPRYQHFGVVDLPGIFRVPTPGQTSKEDIKLVDDIVGKYLHSPRSIILAIVPANVDPVTQAIVQLAEDADPQRKRTLVVLTKPDLVDTGTEQRIIDLVYGQSGLGYHVICNRKHSEIGSSLEDRNENEKKFFRSGVWSAVSTEHCGIESLRARLDSLLIRVTRENFANVHREVEEVLNTAHKRKKALGVHRATSIERRYFIVNLASEFQSYCSKATDAYYGRDQCFRETPILRLATTISQLNTKFSQDMFKKGFTLRFRSEDVDGPDNINNPGAASADNGLPGVESTGESDEVVEVEVEVNREDCPVELRQLFVRRSRFPEPPEGPIKTWIKSTYMSSRSFTVYQSGTSILPALFNVQAQKWSALAENHVETVIIAIHSFMKALLSFLCKDELVCKQLWSYVQKQMTTAYEAAIAHVQFLVSVEMEGNMITQNHYYADNLKKAQAQRIERQLKERMAGSQSWTVPDSKEALVRIADVRQFYTSNEDQEVDDLHDALESYYKVARKRFVDAVCTQAIDYYLLKHGPLQVWSPARLSSIPESDLTDLLQESPERSSERAALDNKIKGLEEGCKILAS